MDVDLISDIKKLNPWLVDQNEPITSIDNYHPRIQELFLLDPEWDQYCILLSGPRQSGKTTLGTYLSKTLIHDNRFQNYLYLNCDYNSIRTKLISPTILSELLEEFKLKSTIVFIDEVQRQENPGVLLKSIIDLKMPIKLIASGSSQLEIKSKVQEFLTGREIESIIMPFSHLEISKDIQIQEQIIYGSYPAVIRSQKKEIILANLYKRYIEKDIIEILRLSKPDVLEKLIILIAHSTGQLVNYQQLALDCRVTSPTIQGYLKILEQSYVIKKITPFVGNKRTEITKNPIFYFIDNGFRNHAMRNFNNLDLRADAGLLVENFIFQEIYKFQTQNFYDFDIHYWRTKTQAEVDFVLFKNDEYILPIEVKFRRMATASVTRGFRSFLEAYNPKVGIIVTKNFKGRIEIGETIVHFIPLEQISKMLKVIENSLELGQIS